LIEIFLLTPFVNPHNLKGLFAYVAGVGCCLGVMH
jgi:hypothetical protein